MKDKDGVSALLLLCELAADAKAEGRSLIDLLDDIAAEHGLHATDQLSVRVSRPRRRSPPRWTRLRDDAADRRSAACGRAVDDLVARQRPTCRRPTACATAWPTAPG